MAKLRIKLDQLLNEREYARVTGETIIYTLYDLCGLNPIKDLMIDAMHAIVLNLIRTELEVMLTDVGRNSGVTPSDGVPSNGGLIDWSCLKREHLIMFNGLRN